MRLGINGMGRIGCLALRAAQRARPLARAFQRRRQQHPLFGFVFAVISSLHSYLILAYAGSEKAAEDVGFYYTANAAGRLMGIMLSGLLTQAGGMQACL